MQGLLPILLIVIVIVVAIAIIALLARRRREAQDAAIAAASTPVPELTEEDIAWRIGASADWPGLLAADYAAAEAEASNLAEDETGRPLVPPPLVPLDPLVPSDQVPIAAAVVAGATRPKAAPAPLPNRWRLWRDSAAVLLVAVLAVLAVTVIFPGTQNTHGAERGAVADRRRGHRVPDRLAQPVAVAVAASDRSADPRVDAGAGRRPHPAADAQAHAEADRPPAGHAPPDAAADHRAAVDAQADPEADAQADAQADPEAHAQADPETDRDPGAARRRIRQLRGREHDPVRLRQLDRLDHVVQLDLR